MSGIIGSLRGTLLDRSVTGEVLVEVAGVGHRVQAGPATVARLGDVGGEVFVWTHHHVREDAQTLYGFATREERDCFEALLGAHGVGPALALAILSVHDPDALRRVIADADVAALCLVPGVGRKTAGRLLVELSSRLEQPPVDVLVPGATGNGVAGDGQAGRVAADVREALTGLGYGPEEVADAMRHLASVPADESSGDVALLLKEALRHLGSVRA